MIKPSDPGYPMRTTTRREGDNDPADPNVVADQVKAEWHRQASQALEQVGETAREVAQIQAQLKLAKKQWREAEKAYCKAVENIQKLESQQENQSQDSIEKKKAAPLVEPAVSQKEATEQLPTMMPPDVGKMHWGSPTPVPWDDVSVVELELPGEIEFPFFEAGMEGLGQIKQALTKGPKFLATTVGISLDHAKLVRDTLDRWLKKHYPAEFPTPANGHSSSPVN